MHILSLVTHQRVENSDTVLWHRDITHDHLPQPGQAVGILKSEDEPEGSVHAEVRTVYFDFDGLAVCDLLGIVVDPSEEQQDRMRRSGRRYVTSWFTVQDGDLIKRLEDCGWVRGGR